MEGVMIEILDGLTQTIVKYAYNIIVTNWICPQSVLSGGHLGLKFKGWGSTNHPLLS